MARILLVDDEPNICRALSSILTSAGHTIEVSASGERALAVNRADPPHLALVDISLPGLGGVETFTALRERYPSLVGVFITAHGSIRSAVAAIRAGGFDYLTKPFDNDDLVLTIERALQLQRLTEEVRSLQDELQGRVVFPGIIGSSPAIQAVLRLLPRIARTDATVLVLGESGTGKELIARNIHRHSPRASQPFLAINCSAIPAGLYDTEFFGHERGAFTDAKETRIGRFEQADGGTLFLDEIGDLPLEAQAKFLRVLEEQRVTRVGGRRPTDINVRIVAATNKNLELEVAQGKFRDDLFWRLNVVALPLPPLRDRLTDIPLLVAYFIERLNQELGRAIVGLSDAVQQAFREYSWPGNIRELENTLRRALIVCEASLVDLADIPTRITDHQNHDRIVVDDRRARATLAETVTQVTGRVERDLIREALTEHRGNRSAAANALGINRKTLFLKMRLYGLSTEAVDTDLDRE